MATHKKAEKMQNSPPGGAVAQIFLVVRPMSAGVTRGGARLGGRVDRRVGPGRRGRGNARAGLARHGLLALKGLAAQVVHDVYGYVEARMGDAGGI